MCPPAKIVVLTQAVTLKVIACVNRFYEAVSVTVSVNRKWPPLLMMGINRGGYFLCPPKSSKKMLLLISFCISVLVLSHIHTDTFGVDFWLIFYRCVFIIPPSSLCVLRGLSLWSRSIELLWPSLQEIYAFAAQDIITGYLHFTSRYS